MLHPRLSCTPQLLLEWIHLIKDVIHACGPHFDREVPNLIYIDLFRERMLFLHSQACIRLTVRSRVDALSEYKKETQHLFPAPSNTRRRKQDATKELEKGYLKIQNFSWPPNAFCDPSLSRYPSNSTV